MLLHWASTAHVAHLLPVLGLVTLLILVDLILGLLTGDILVVLISSAAASARKGAASARIAVVTYLAKLLVTLIITFDDSVKALIFHLNVSHFC